MAEWLTGLGLGEYKDIFLENDISGECHLCQCDSMCGVLFVNFVLHTENSLSNLCQHDLKTI